MPISFSVTSVTEDGTQIPQSGLKTREEVNRHLLDRIGYSTVYVAFLIVRVSTDDMIGLNIIVEKLDREQAQQCALSWVRGNSIN